MTLELELAAADRRARWDLAFLYAAVIAGYPLVSGVPIALGLDSRVITVPYRAFVLGVTLFAIARTAARREYYTGPLWMPFVAFWTMYLARMIADTMLFPVPLVQPRGEYFIYGIGTVLLPAIALFARPSRATLELALRLTIGMGTVAAFSVLVLGFRALLSGDLAAIASGRFELWTLDPISLGHLGASLAGLALFQLRRGGAGTVAARAWNWAAVALGVVCTGVSASKGPLLALGANVALIVFLDWRAGHRLRAALVAVVAPVLGVLGARYLEDQWGFGVVSRLQAALNDPEVASVSERVGMLHRATEQFLASPLVGSSLEERVMGMYPHNTLLESFMAVGVLGGLAYAVFHVAALRHAVQLLTRRREAAWVAMLCVQYSLNSLFSGALYISAALWCSLAASTAIMASAAPLGEPSGGGSFGAVPVAYPS